MNPRGQQRSTYFKLQWDIFGFDGGGWFCPSLPLMQICHHDKLLQRQRYKRWCGLCVVSPYCRLSGRKSMSAKIYLLGICLSTFTMLYPVGSLFRKPFILSLTMRLCWPQIAIDQSNVDLIDHQVANTMILKCFYIMLWYWVGMCWMKCSFGCRLKPWL